MNYKLRAKSYKLKALSYELREAISYQLRATSFETSYELRAKMPAPVDDSTLLYLAID
jgi:hypothetical protein